MSRVPPLLIALLGLALPAFAADRATSVASLLQSQENVEFLRAPERVEVCLLTAKEPLFRKKSGKRRYVEGDARSLPPASVERLRTRLASDDNYRWHTAAEGEPVWNLRVKFYRGKDYLSADFCFESGLVLFARDGLPFSAEDYVDPDDEFFALLRAPFAKEKSLRAIAATVEARQKDRAARNAGFEKAGGGG